MSILLSNFFAAMGTDNNSSQTKLLTAPWEDTAILIKGIEIVIEKGTINYVQIYSTYNPYTISGGLSAPVIVLAHFVPTSNDKSYRATWFEDKLTGFQFPAFQVSSPYAIYALLNTGNDTNPYTVNVNIIYYRVTDV